MAKKLILPQKFKIRESGKGLPSSTKTEPIHAIAGTLTAGVVTGVLTILFDFTVKKDIILEWVDLNAYSVNAGGTYVPLDFSYLQLSNPSGISPFKQVLDVNSGYDVNNRFSNTVQYMFSENKTQAKKLGIVLNAGMDYELSLSAFRTFNIGDSFRYNLYLGFKE